MASNKTAATLPVPGAPSIPQGTPFSVYRRGTETYEALRVNGPVTLTLDDGSTREAIVQAMQVGPLVDMLTNYGPQNIYLAGRIYSPVSLVQALTDANGEEVLDVTKIYTAVVVQVPPQLPTHTAA